jgi:hypothetical protein
LPLFLIIHRARYDTGLVHDIEGLLDRELRIEDDETIA